jgi:hypothetical protein
MLHRIPKHKVAGLEAIMEHRYPANVTVLILGILIAAVGTFFPLMSGSMFRNGAPIVVAVFLIGKGASTLRCRTSDVLLSGAAFVLVVLSKLVPSQVASPVVFHVAALALMPVFVMTGLTFKAITTERRKRKQPGATGT